MNVQTRVSAEKPAREEAEQALALLRDWATHAAPEEIATLDPGVARLIGAAPAEYPALARAYPEDFKPDAGYRDTLPDLQNGPESLIRGARRA